MIPAGVVGGIFAFTKIFDAFMDPIAGASIDRRKTSAAAVNSARLC